MEEKKSNKKIIYIVMGVITILAIAAIIISLLLLSRTHRLIKVIETEGKVTVEREKEGILDAFIEMVLKSGDTVTTDKESRLYMQLDGDKYVELMPESVMHIVATGDVEKNNTRTRIILDKGSVINEIQTHLGDDEGFDVETQSVCLGVRGTKFEVKASQNDDVKETYIEVLDGTVEAYREGEADTVKIEAGYHVTIKETDSLSEVEVEENYPYIDFGFNIYDVRLFGRSLQEMNIEEIRKEYNINDKNDEIEPFNQNDVYYSPDKKLAYDEGEYGKNVRVRNIVGDEERYTALYSELSNGINKIYEMSMQNRNDSSVTDKYYTRLLSDDMSEEDARAFILADKIDELFNEGKYYIKCNWSDDVYMINYVPDDDWYTYFITNTQNEDSLSFKIFERTITNSYCDLQISIENTLESSSESVEFGTFEGEPIVWDILEEDDNSMLLISRYLLKEVSFDQGGTASTDTVDTNWNQSEIRKYLNNEFFQTCFSKEEQQRIEKVTINNKSINEGFIGTYYEHAYTENTKPYVDSQDFVYLLSWDEVVKFYGVEKTDMWPYSYKATATYKDGEAFSYWLRSTGGVGNSAMYVGKEGDVHEAYVSGASAIRPVIRITKN